MDIRITPKKLSGPVTPPPSKSMAHRAVLAMMLAGEGGTISNLGDSQDIQATRRCVETLKTATPGQLPYLDCGESGSTLRFLIPIALAVAGGGQSSLPRVAHLSSESSHSPKNSSSDIC